MKALRKAPGRNRMCCREAPEPEVYLRLGLSVLEAGDAIQKFHIHKPQAKPDRANPEGKQLVGGSRDLLPVT